MLTISQYSLPPTGIDVSENPIDADPMQILCELNERNTPDSDHVGANGEVDHGVEEPAKVTGEGLGTMDSDFTPVGATYAIYQAAEEPTKVTEEEHVEKVDSASDPVKSTGEIDESSQEPATLAGVGIEQVKFSSNPVCITGGPSKSIPDTPTEVKRGREQIIRGPLDYLLFLPGKDIRGKLMRAFNEWLKIPKEKLEAIGDIVNLLHTASLLIDDIQDSSQLRRGLPVAHNIFGVAQTINSANYAFFLAQEKLSALDKNGAGAAFVEELLNLHRGQGMDLYWRDTLVCPSEEEYITMVMNKTGGLFRLGVKLMQLESDQNCDCVPLADLLGIIFQIRDDILNLTADDYTKNKGFCEDITEGKFSFPIIHSINSAPDNLQLLNILKQHSEDQALKLYAVEYITSTKSLSYSHQKLDMLLKEAVAFVETLDEEMGASLGMRHLLEILRLE